MNSCAIYIYNLEYDMSKLWDSHSNFLIVQCSNDIPMASVPRSVESKLREELRASAEKLRGAEQVGKTGSFPWQNAGKMVENPRKMVENLWKMVEMVEHPWKMLKSLEISKWWCAGNVYEKQYVRFSEKCIFYHILLEMFDGFYI